jgi:hypothetical protein
VCVVAGDVADGTGSVAVVLGVVGGVDRIEQRGVDATESDVAFDAGGADATGAAGEGVSVPRPTWTASGRT